jgi:hypothetical protein
MTIGHVEGTAAGSIDELPEALDGPSGSYEPTAWTEGA